MTPKTHITEKKLVKPKYQQCFPELNLQKNHCFSLIMIKFVVEPHHLSQFAVKELQQNLDV